MESAAALPLLFELISKPALGTIVEASVLTAATTTKNQFVRLAGLAAIIVPKIFDIHTFSGAVSDVCLGILAFGLAWDFISRGLYNVTD